MTHDIQTDSSSSLGPWPVVELGKTAEFVNGRAFKPSDWATSGIPIVRIQNLNGGTAFNYFAGNIEPRYGVVTGDLLFSWSGTRGTSFGPHFWRGPAAVLNQHIFNVRNRQDVDRGYLYYALKLLTVAVEKRAHGGTGIVHITKGQLEALRVPKPELSEQRKIAAILSAVDDAIEGTQAVLDQLQVVRNAMMSELLTRGLPGQHTTFRKTEIGEVPEGWDFLSLEYLCSHIVDCPHETPDCIDVGYPVIRTADVVPGKILLAQARRVSAETYTRRTRRLQPEAGDVLYSREGERYGIAAPVPRGVQLCLGQRMMQFRASQETDPSFLCWLLNSPQVYQQARDEVGGSTSPHVNIKSIRKFVVARPPLSEQRQIGIALDVLCEREAAEDSVVGVLRTLKTALMSVLLTGELRVTPDEATP